jgi:uncharacterized protein YbcI
MCPLSVEPATLISRFTRICGGPNQPASRPIYQEPLAAVSHSDNCRKEDLRWDDSPLSGFLVRRGLLNRRRTGHRMASSRVGIKKRAVGEMEAAVCQGVSRFEQDYMGRGPKDIHAHLLGDLLVVRLQGVLTAAEQHLAKSPSGEKGRDLLKQMRAHLIETARPVLEAMVREVTGVKVLSMHHDISTVTGEKVVLFTLAKSPILRDVKKK